jgi:sulfatase modifying factor 1
LTKPETSRRRTTLAILLALCLLVALWKGGEAARWFIAMQTSSGDLSGIHACGALANQEGRPGTFRYGCMVPIPSHRQLESLSSAATRPHETDLFSFLMGAQSTDPQGPGYDPEASDDEHPVRRVTLDPFWMTRYEITVKQFKDCVLLGPCSMEHVGLGGFFNYDRKGSEDHPINGVTWHGADHYCRWVGGSLPTEAQWEYVAKAGHRGRRFPWSPDDTPATCEHAVFAGPSDAPCGVFGTAYSGIHPRLADDVEMMVQNLAGNVWEWTSDWYAPSYGAPGDTSNPSGPETGTGRVQRGGGYTEEDPLVFRSAFRAQMAPDMKLPDVGFRCVAATIDHPAQRAEVSFQRVLDLSHWSGDLDAWVVQGGVLRAKEAGGELRWRDETFVDGELLSHLWLSKGRAGLRYGLAPDSDDGFTVRLDGASLRMQLTKDSGGQQTVLGEAALSRPPEGSWHRVGVRVEDGIHRITSHGEVALVVFDNDWPGDRVGLVAETGSDTYVSDIFLSE